MNSKIEARDKRFTKKVKRAIDMWVIGQNLNVDNKKHQGLAEAITKYVSDFLIIPSQGHQLLLLDYDGDNDGYKNPRIDNRAWEGPEEALFPIDPETDEPVEKTVADFVWPLPDINCVPEV